MAITAEKYQQLKSVLSQDAQAADEDKLSDDVREQALAAIQAFDDQFLNRGQGGQGPTAPGETRILGQQPAVTEDSLVNDIKRRLDPSLPVQPQVLSIQPATGHAKGDQAAQDEWVRGDLDNPNGQVIVYDAPAATVRQKILENPEILGALGYDAPLTPEAVQSIQSGDSIHQAYNDYLWRQTADAAVKGGKTPYRYSKAPWLKDGAGQGVLSTLGTKVKAGALPGISQATAFVMGVDDTASFGAATSATEAGLLDQQSHGLPSNPTVVPGAVASGAKDEMVGGITTSDSREMTDQLREEHPTAFTAGQIVGAVPGVIEAGGKAALGAIGGVTKKLGLEGAESAARGGLEAISAWNPSNRLWEWVTSRIPTEAPKGLIASGGRVLQNVAGGAVAGGVNQAVTEGVRAGANLVGTGDTGTSLGNVAANVTNAALWGGGTSAPGAIAQVAGARHAAGVQEGPRYQGLPGRLERLGVEPEFGKGFTAPKAVAEVQDVARARDVSPVDVYAERLEKPLATAAKANDAGARMRVRDSSAEVYRSREGRMLLPAQQTVETSLDLLRKRSAPIGRNRPTAVGVPNADKPVRGIFNANLGGVSVHPVEGAIPMSVKEAEAYLNPVWQRRTLDSMRRGKAVKTPSADTARGDVAPEPKRLGNSTELARTSQAPEDLTYAGKALARTPRYSGSRRPELTSSDVTKAAGDSAVRGSRSPTAGERTGSETPRVTARNLGPDAPEGARWRRTEASGAKPKGGQPRDTSASFGDQLRARGVKTVYVTPRRYNAQHHESAIQVLRKASDNTAKDRDLVQVYHAALRDRDARPWRGEPGGWSKLQGLHEREIGAARDVTRRVAPKGKSDGTFKAVSRVAKQAKGQSKDLDAMQAMAERAGVADELRGARTLDPLERLGRRLQGGNRAPWSPSRLYDEGNIKIAYPITRQLAKPATRETGKVGRVLQGDRESEDRRKQRDEKRAPAYAKKTAAARKAASSTSGKKVRRRSADKKVRRRKEEDE